MGFRDGEPQPGYGRSARFVSRSVTWGSLFRQGGTSLDLANGRQPLLIPRFDSRPPLPTLPDAREARRDGGGPRSWQLRSIRLIGGRMDCVAETGSRNPLRFRGCHGSAILTEVRCVKGPFRGTLLLEPRRFRSPTQLGMRTPGRGRCPSGEPLPDLGTRPPSERVKRSRSLRRAGAG